jgi:protein involved in polysaccharide export with SLBB domain
MAGCVLDVPFVALAKVDGSVVAPLVRALPVEGKKFGELRMVLRAESAGGMRSKVEPGGSVAVGSSFSEVDAEAAAVGGAVDVAVGMAEW